MKYQTNTGATCEIMIKILTAFSLCFGWAVTTQATNTVTGLAYGTNYTDLATAGHISSISDNEGSVVIGYSGTTNLTLSHSVSGYAAVTNSSDGFTVTADGGTLSGPGNTVATFMALGVTNLSVEGGTFQGAPSTSGGGNGGWISDSSAFLNGSTFAGSNTTIGLRVDNSTVVVSNATITGGDEGTGLYATNSSVTIHSGTIAGGELRSGIWLDNSDAIVFDGTFIGDDHSTGIVYGGGLFSRQTTAATNSVLLHGGTYSSLVFTGVDGSVQHFQAGTNLVVLTDIVQDGGTVIVDNRADEALSEIYVLDGTMLFPSNSFTLAEGGIFHLVNPDSTAFFKNLRVASNATLRLDVSTLTADSFTALPGSTILLSISDTTNGVLDTGSAWFQTNSTVWVDAVGTGMSSSETNEFALIITDTNKLFAGSSTNSAASAEEFKENVDVETSTSARADFFDLYFDTINGQTVVKFQFTAQSLNDYWDLTNGTSTVVTEEFATELEDLAGSDMLAIIDGYGDPDASLAAIEEAYFTTYNTFQTVLNGMQGAVGQSVSRGAEFREQVKLRPSGARGPQHSSTLRGWAKYYGQRYEHDPDGLNPSYDTAMDGGVVGVDMSFGTLLAGIAGGWGLYNTESGNNGEEEINAYHGSLYGTMGLDKAYIDAGVAYGFNEVETRTASPFTMNGEFDAQILSAYLGGGIDLVDSNEGMVFTPEASVQYSMYEQDDYAETSTVAVPRRFESFDADSLRTSVGINVSVLDPVKMETFHFKYDIRLHWIHEFNPDPGSMNFSLDGGNNGYQLTHPFLDEDIYRAGIGAVFSNAIRNQPQNVLFRIDFDEFFGDGFNSHNLSAKVIYAF